MENFKYEDKVIISDGRMYAERCIAAGQREASESPLSGEFADEPTVLTIARKYGITDEFEDFEDYEVLADAWEAGYYSAPWPERVED